MDGYLYYSQVGGSKRKGPGWLDLGFKGVEMMDWTERWTSSLHAKDFPSQSKPLLAAVALVHDARTVPMHARSCCLKRALPRLAAKTFFFVFF
jgi:hypothetical protein